MPDRISIDELLAHQESPPLRATVEPVEGTPDAVTVTPWAPAGGCLCHGALEVPKDAIEWVAMTGETHLCCGKTLPVVELGFAQDATVRVEDAFRRLSANAAHATARPVPMFHPAFALAALGPRNPCWEAYKRCIDRASELTGDELDAWLEQCEEMRKRCMGEKKLPMPL
jgi:hypothetical protein